MQVHGKGFLDPSRGNKNKLFHPSLLKPVHLGLGGTQNHKKMKKSVLFILVVLLSIVSANAQIKRISATRLNAVPTTEEKKAIEKAEDVKLDVLHGSSNWFIGAIGGYTFDGEVMAGLRGGRRFSDHFRLEALGMYNFTNEGGKKNHSWIAVAPAFDLVNSQSSFYQKTGLDISIAPLIGVKEQSKAKVKYEGTMKDFDNRLRLTYGGMAEISWNCAKHVQLRAGINYLHMSEEGKTKDQRSSLKEGLSEEAQLRIDKQNWQSGQLMATFSVTFHF